MPHACKCFLWDMSLWDTCNVELFALFTWSVPPVSALMASCLHSVTLERSGPSVGQVDLSAAMDPRPIRMQHPI
eukprot:5260153-Amphidinium_carterae.1